MSVTHRESQCQSHYFWATQHGFKARPGLVHVQGASRAPDVQCIFYTAGVRAAFKPMRMQTLMNLKNCIPEEKKRSVVYEVPCKDCSKTYTGETKRALKVILSEHKQAVSINSLHYIARTLKQ